MASKAKKKEQVVAGLVVRRKKDGKILVIKRTDGRWDLPKGHRDPGESTFQAATRETYEETGLRPDVDKAGVVSFIKKSGKELTFYPATIKKAKIKLDPNEHTDYQWVVRSKAIKLLDRNKILQKAVARLAEDAPIGWSEDGLVYVMEATMSGAVGPFTNIIGGLIKRQPLKLLGDDACCERCKKGLKCKRKRRAKLEAFLRLAEDQRFKRATGKKFPDLLSQIKRYVGKKDIGIHFSKLPQKLGVYPMSDFKTPIGVYGYVLTPTSMKDLEAMSVSDVGGGKELSEFANERKFIHLFRIKPKGGRIIHINKNGSSPDYTEKDWERDWVKIRKIGNLNRGVHNYRERHREKSAIQLLWDTTRYMKGVMMNPAKWGAMLRKLGITAIVDNGSSTIHGNEPYQMVVLRGDALERLVSGVNPHYNLRAGVGFKARDRFLGIIDALKDKDKTVLGNAAHALGKIGPKAAKAVPALIKVLKDKDEGVRINAAYALGMIGPKAAKAVPVLIETLKDKDWRVRWNAAQALGKIGPAAEKAVPALIEALKDKDRLVRMKVAKALKQIKPGINMSQYESIDCDSNLNEDEDRRLNALRRRVYADPEDFSALNQYVNILKRMGDYHGSNDMLVLIWNLLYHKSDDVRRSAATALGNIGPKAEKAVPALIQALKDKHEFVRYYAAIALGKIGRGAEKAVPALIEALKDKDKWVRFYAAVALRDLGPKAGKAVPALSQALKDEDWIFRRIAVQALKKIKPGIDMSQYESMDGLQLEQRAIPDCSPLQPPDPDCTLVKGWDKAMRKRRGLKLLKRKKIRRG